MNDRQRQSGGRGLERTPSWEGGFRPDRGARHARDGCPPPRATDPAAGAGMRSKRPRCRRLTGAGIGAPAGRFDAPAVFLLSGHICRRTDHGGRKRGGIGDLEYTWRHNSMKSGRGA